MGKFFGTNNVNCNADATSGQPLGENIPASIDASTYTYTSAYALAQRDPFAAKDIVFWKGTNGYYGAWKINGISVTLPPAVTTAIGRLTGSWYFQTNGSPYFDSGIRTVDLEGKTRPAQTAYDMGAYEYYPPNQTPTDIALSGTSVAEGQPGGTAVSTLSTTDPDVGDTFTYTLVAGTGSMDNASFAISGSTLQTAAMFNYGIKNSYSIRVRSTDLDGLFTEKAFIIVVTKIGDINGDAKIDLTDFILLLQILSKQGSLPSIEISGDINADGKIGMEEAIYILQKLTGTR